MSKKPTPAKPAAVVDKTTMPDWAPQFFAAWITTGDVLKGLDAVGVAMDVFLALKAECVPFREEFKRMAPRATESLRLRALSMGLSGSDRMLQLFLKSLEAEEADDVSKLSDAQLDQRINGLLGRARLMALEQLGPAGVLAAMDARRAEFTAKHGLTEPTPSAEAAP